MCRESLQAQTQPSQEARGTSPPRQLKSYYLMSGDSEGSQGSRLPGSWKDGRGGTSRWSWHPRLGRTVPSTPPGSGLSLYSQAECAALGESQRGLEAPPCSEASGGPQSSTCLHGEGLQAEKPHGTKSRTHTVDGLLRVMQLTILLGLLGKRRPRAAQAPAQSHRSQGPI